MLAGLFNKIPVSIRDTASFQSLISNIGFGLDATFIIYCISKVAAPENVGGFSTWGESAQQPCPVQCSVPI